MKIIFDYNQSNTKHTPSQEKDVDLPEDLKRRSLPLQDVNEIQIIRHYTKLSRKIMVLIPISIL
jgi:glycine cleavage system protein P-like pyridoxal-binding family